ncbi:MAG: response regulator transcription factor [Candidatus Limnocylindria bacterium]
MFTAARSDSGGASDPDRLRERGLSPREVTVAQLVARGLTNEEIARELGLSPLTVKKHLERLYAKVGVGNRTALAAWIWERSRTGT